MQALLADPRARAWLFGLLLLLGAWLAARALAFVAERLLARVAERAGAGLEARLLRALVTPLAYALFLAGAALALDRLPTSERWARRLDGLVFALAALLLTTAALRAWSRVMAWYTDPARPGARDGPALEFGPLFSKAGKVALVLLGMLAVFQHFQVNLASLAISLGVGSLAVGLAAQDTLANMFAGFTLLLDRPFHIGDRVVLASGETGDVLAIGMRATRIRTVDESVLVVPNSLLVKERLTNRSQPTRHVVCRIELELPWTCDLERAKAELCASAQAVPQVDAARGVAALVARFGEGSLRLLLAFQARDYLEQGAAVSAVHEEIQRRFAAAGIELHVPHDRPRAAPDEGKPR